jgi:hypothetical protein
MSQTTFPILILIGRPASGKSEIIDTLQRTPGEQRRQKYHLAELDVLDDFPMLWTWFEEDHILSHVLRQPRLHTDDQGDFKYPYLWNLLIERFNLEYEKRLRDAPGFFDHTSLLIEFARGSQHGGYAEAFAHLSDALLRQAGVVYVNVSFDESLRKNRRRFNPDRPHSILEHALPDDKLERLYREADWANFSAADPRFLLVRSLRVPYVVFENEDDVTTHQPDLLAARLETVMGQLWEIRESA